MMGHVLNAMDFVLDGELQTKNDVCCRHSDFAAAYIVLLMPIYVWRLTARAVYLHQKG